MHKKDITAIDSKTLASIVLETHDVLLLETFVVGNLRWEDRLPGLSQLFLSLHNQVDCHGVSPAQRTKTPAMNRANTGTPHNLFRRRCVRR